MTTSTAQVFGVRDPHHHNAWDCRRVLTHYPRPATARNARFRLQAVLASEPMRAYGMLTMFSQPAGSWPR